MVSSIGSRNPAGRGGLPDSAKVAMVFEECCARVGLDKRAWRMTATTTSPNNTMHINILKKRSCVVPFCHVPMNLFWCCDTCCGRRPSRQTTASVHRYTKRASPPCCPLRAKRKFSAWGLTVCGAVLSAAHRHSSTPHTVPTTARDSSGLCARPCRSDAVLAVRSRSSVRARILSRPVAARIRALPNRSSTLNLKVSLRQDERPSRGQHAAAQMGQGRVCGQGGGPPKGGDCHGVSFSMHLSGRGNMYS